MNVKGAERTVSAVAASAPPSAAASAALPVSVVALAGIVEKRSDESDESLPAVNVRLVIAVNDESDESEPTSCSSVP